MSNKDIRQTFGLKHPIIQAPMAGGATTPELVSAVCNNGALGSIGAGYLSPIAISEHIHATKQLTSKPFNVNLFVPSPFNADRKQLQHMQEILAPLYQQLGQPAPDDLPKRFEQNFHHQVETLLREKIPAFSFTFGIPDSEILKEFKKQNSIILGTATSVEEAALLAESVDMVVLQGAEAGGHRGTFIGREEDALTPILSLIKQVQSENIKCPLIASGGIGRFDDIKHVLKAGAIVAQIGTLFLSCDESGIASCYKQRLIEAEHDCTALTRAFSGKLARGIFNQFTEKLEGIKPLDYPVQNAMTQPLRKLASSQEHSEYMSLWAGQSLSHCHKGSVQKLIKTLTQPT
ncbi:nitronate monooxygenase [Piscirickettsia litoralis]|uniref:Propionate 3-nitronate monooxygenase n=1 Tax=Piscirickettsia litoralis TaxID=1891921 RepID=A0ABX3AD10_9GAMM|nr:nitronate monooxygenase [Piscirickettsia litoralis]